jgi:hypothetical protein
VRGRKKKRASVRGYKQKDTRVAGTLGALQGANLNGVLQSTVARADPRVQEGRQ